jgi:hypothetical protein
LLPRFVKLCPSVPGHSEGEDVDDEVMEAELIVVLCGLITIDGREEDEDCDVRVDVLDLDVTTEDDSCGVVLELLEVLVLDVGLMVVVGTGVEETTIVLEVTDVGRDELVELAVEITVDDVLTSAQSVETQ